MIDNERPQAQVLEAPGGTYWGRQVGAIRAFAGIAYAQAPVGALRFLPPVPLHAARSGPAPAAGIAKDPWQKQQAAPFFVSRQELDMSEDCLQLNVWTPACDGAKRPVLVHIFGGGFQRGSANSGYMDPASLCEVADAVVIRVGFRTGALGWLYLGDVMGPEFAAGNVALLDVQAALQWIRDNLAAFGGDPDNVTLFGLSSGAFMIAALLAMPGASRLFRRGWMMSGSASRIVQRSDASALAEAILARLGIVPGDIAALRAVAPQAIVDAQESAITTDVGLRNAPGGRTLGVVLDGHTLTTHPLAAFTGGAAVDHEMVIGTTYDETQLWFTRGLMTELADEDALRHEIELYAGTVAAPRLHAAYASAYGHMSLNQRRERFLSHAIYRAPAHRTAEAQCRAGGRAFVYRFDWMAPPPWDTWRSSHAFDEPFLWGKLDVQATPFALGAGAQALSREMTAALVAFARHGDPGWEAFCTAGSFHVFDGGSAARPDESAVIQAWNIRAPTARIDGSI